MGTPDPFVRITFRIDKNGKLYPLFDGKPAQSRDARVESATSIPSLARIDFLLPEGLIVEGDDRTPPKVETEDQPAEAAAESPPEVPANPTEPEAQP